MPRTGSYFFRVQSVPDQQYRQQLMNAAQVFMDAGFLRELLDRLYGLNAALANMEREHELDVQHMRPHSNMRAYTACLHHLQRLNARIEQLREEACFAAAQQVFLQTGKRLPPIEDMNKPAAAIAAKVWDDFAQTATRFKAGLEAKAAQAAQPAPQAEPDQPTPAPKDVGLLQPEPPRPITGKELKMYVSLLVKARVPETVREQFKQQARQGKFSLPQLQQRVAELTTSQAA